jgi:O-Antigen ligase
MLIVHLMLRRDLERGVAAAVFFLVLLPNELQVEMPGALPELTGQRAVLLVLLFNLVSQIRSVSLSSVSGLLWLLCLIGLSRMGSTLFTALDAAASFKVVFGYLIETVLYFVLIATGLRSRRAIQLVAWSSLLALITVAAIGILQRRTGLNVVAIVVPGMIEDPSGVTATFRHRILFGFAMAMGFPLALALTGDPETKWKRILAFLGLLMLPAACYFGNSRGPWLGCAVAGVVMGILGSRVIRRRLALAGLLTAVVLVVRPGTYETIHDLWEQSFSKDTIKGRSTEYRKVLWSVASSELAKSPETMLLGYGGHSTELLDLSEYFEQGHGGTTAGLGHTSWDSQYASDFMQYGYLGFGLEVLLYLAILRRTLKTWRASGETDRDFAAAGVAIALIFCWAMSTVAIFNAQLDYFFWTFVAIAGRLHSVSSPLELGSVADSQVEDQQFDDPAGSFEHGH